MSGKYRPDEKSFTVIRAPILLASLQFLHFLSLYRRKYIKPRVKEFYGNIWFIRFIYGAKSKLLGHSLILFDVHW